MNRVRFQEMKKTALFINIGRGITTRLDALVEALRAGEIAGAGLDVFEQEPLPADHPLWTMPGVLLTPHVAGYGPHLDERRYDIILDNCRRFLAGQPLRAAIVSLRFGDAVVGSGKGGARVIGVRAKTLMDETTMTTTHLIGSKIARSKTARNHKDICFCSSVRHGENLGALVENVRFTFLSPAVIAWNCRGLPRLPRRDGCGSPLSTTY